MIISVMLEQKHELSACTRSIRVLPYVLKILELDPGHCGIKYSFGLFQGISFACTFEILDYQITLVGLV